MKIDIFSHIVPPKFKSALGRIAPQAEKHVERVPTLYDLERRFRILDAYGEIKQVLTMAMTPARMLENPKVAVELAKRANDDMAETVANNPDRFAAGVASLPMTDMEAAERELDRAVRELGLKGIQIFTPRNGMPLQLGEYHPLFAKMAKYNLPVWLHPYRPFDMDDYREYFTNHVFGWPYESSATMAYLVLDGLFEAFPGIKIIVHHCGAMIPFCAEKMQGGYDASRGIHGINGKELPRPFLDYFKMFFTDTAISGSTAGLMCGYAFFGIGHMLFGTDMPYDAEQGERLVRTTIQSVDRMAVSDLERKMIYENNAVALLGLGKD